MSDGCFSFRGALRAENLIGFQTLAGDNSGAAAFAKAAFVGSTPTLTLSMGISTSAPLVGGEVTYTITVGNTVGGDSANNVVVTDLLPIGLTYDSSTSADYNSTTGVWTVGTVNFNTSETLMITATVDSSSEITNTATATDSDGSPPQSVSANETPAPCYAAGALIRTARGDVAVENLAVGELVLTASGERRPILWLGHRRVDCRRHPRPDGVRPIRIAAHAFGPDKPTRDLDVSPGHAICVDIVGEVLIPASALVNGATITQVAVDEITYWHVELDGHDILIAENLPAESFLDMGNRGFFAESSVVDLGRGPDGDLTPRTHADFCRPLHAGGALVDVVRSQLCARAQSLGWTLRSDPLADLHLIVDGVRVDAKVQDLCAHFAVPAGSSEIWLASGAARPRDVGRGLDDRLLGVCLGKVFVDDGFAPAREIPLDDPSLGAGFQKVERNADRVWRWTTGRARFPAALAADHPDGFFLRVELSAEALPRWIPPVGAEVRGATHGTQAA